MEIAIITLHRPENCGSALQAVALCRALGQRYGREQVRVIDYIPSYSVREGGLVRSLLRKAFFLIPYCRRRRRFDRFVETHCRLTDTKYRSYRQLCLAPPAADVYVSGSDQIWNPGFPCGGDPAFFLQFVRKGAKISYASSLGSDTLSQAQLAAVARRIRGYRFVSVREQCSVAQLQAAGVPEVQWVCDPTMLLPVSVYDAWAVDYKHLGRYVAVYLVERSPLLEQVLAYFRSRGCKIVGVAGYLKKYKCDVHIPCAGPAEFLGLIRDASFVVATSFHAAVFAQLFHKQFAIIPPGMNPARIRQLLAYTGLSDRVLTQSSQLPQLQQPIDYDAVQTKIDALRQASASQLFQAVDAIGEAL